MFLPNTMVRTRPVFSSSKHTHTTHTRCDRRCEAGVLLLSRSLFRKRCGADLSPGRHEKEGYHDATTSSLLESILARRPSSLSHQFWPGAAEMDELCLG